MKEAGQHWKSFILLSLKSDFFKLINHDATKNSRMSNLYDTKV